MIRHKQSQGPSAVRKLVNLTVDAVDNQRRIVRNDYKVFGSESGDQGLWKREIMR